MSGQAGLRGYLLQTIVSGIQSLQADGQWETFRLEPGSAEEKADFILEGDSCVHAFQVRSSENQMGKGDVDAWADEFKKGVVADRHELILLGPVAGSIAGEYAPNGVVVTSGHTSNLLPMWDLMCMSIARFIENDGGAPRSASQLIVIGQSLAAEFATIATRGGSLSRNELSEKIRSVVNAVSDADDYTLEKRQHDKDIFVRSEAIVTGASLRGFLDHVATAHSYKESREEQISEYCRFLRATENTYVWPPLREAAEDLAQSLGTLERFMAFRYHVHPASQQGTNLWKALEPSLRGGDGEDRELFDKWMDENDELVLRCEQSFARYRFAIKLQLLV